jgi:hypothetical protein
MKRKRKRAVRVYESFYSYRVYGRGAAEWWGMEDEYWGGTRATEQECVASMRRLTGPALAAWLREHPKPKGK